MPEQAALEKEKHLRLPRYYDIVNISSFGTSLFFFFVVLFFPEATNFIVSRQLFLGTLFSLMVMDSMLLFFGRQMTKFGAFFMVYFKNIVWAALIVVILYAMGGVMNYFGFIMVFGIIGTIFSLEARATFTVGVIAELFFAALIFLDERFPHTLSYYIIGFSQVIFIGLFILLLYIVIKEALRERYEKEEARRKFMDLAEVDRAKSEFVTIVSHQLLTPLSELRWAFYSIMEAKRWNKTTANTVKRSAQSVDTLIGIVRDMIRVSDMQREKVIRKQEEVDLADMIYDVISALHDEIVIKEVKVNFGEKSGSFKLYCDPERLRTALLNVVANAVRYSPGGVVTISLFEEKGGVKIKVSDTGIGIPYEEQARIFTKFFRASNALKAVTDASGVGLFIAKSIIERHDGAIDFISEPNKGSTFSIFLPRLKVS